MSENEYKIIFSKNLKDLLNLNKKTQQDLINDLNLSSSTVSNWCTGQKLPRMSKIELLANYFNVSKSDLLEEKNPCSITDDADLKRIAEARKKMNPEQKEYMMKILTSVFDDFFNEN
ncbi:helix-turn-helix domain-containing protein [Clostridium butyricum]|uniref:helix-turn-helix domain-containing protein n=1 Tax=Clostridium butyricum TaxID=1492 RepID=UPI002103ADA1|nr:helix-turn-helix transcriptional regulator [Clostridium butyricum]MCQ2014682.1 helix-turn-helix domain-containing protein [Clostridium butyricum]MCQ2026551.1 helix-turn-helix domain-containing protein [Clostridium butyricum]